MSPSGPSATPSPRWPIRSIARCSTTLGLDEEFAVAVAAEDRGGLKAADTPAERGNKGADVLADELVHRFVAHDAFLDMAPRRLELRLDQRDKRRPRGQQLFD